MTTLQNTTLRRPASIGSRDSALARASAPPRALELYVVRESDEWDLVMFDAMRQQTYTPYAADPWIRAVLLAGMTPLECSGSFTITVELDGETVTREVLVEKLSLNRTTAVLFCVGGRWHLWSMSSAARVDEDGLNDFTQLLSEVVTRLRPERLVAANFSRIIRSYDQGVKLQDAMFRAVDRVCAGSSVFEFTGPHAVTSKLMFGMFATIASMEREWIVARLMAGRIAKWRRGEWLPGRSAIPFGYRFNAATRRLEADLGVRENVRQMLIALCDVGVAPRQMLRRLASLGVTTAKKNKRTDQHMPVSVVGSPRAFIDNLYSWAALWTCGEYLTRFTSPLRDIDEVAGVPVVRDEETPGDVGEFQLLSKVDLPDGGWAEQEVLDAFLAAATTRARERASGLGMRPRALGEHVRAISAHPDTLAGLFSPVEMRGAGIRGRARRARRRGTTQVALLSGTTWEDTEATFELQVSANGYYKLLRWPKGLFHGRGRSGSPLDDAPGDQL